MSRRHFRGTLVAALLALLVGNSLAQPLVGRVEGIADVHERVPLQAGCLAGSIGQTMAPRKLGGVWARKR